MHQYRISMSLMREQPEGSFFQFPQLLAFARILSCSNPRDKIYALLGIVSPGALSISPDYDKSVEEVYGEAVRHWINQTECLDILFWVTDEPRRRLPNCPSWIGEFDVIHPINQQEIAGMSTRHCATGSSVALPVELKPKKFRVLTVHGKEIDHIAELAEPWAWHGLDVDFDPLWTSMVLKLPKLYPTGQTRGEALVRTIVADEIKGAQMDLISILDAFKATVRRDTCFALIRHLHRLCWFTKVADPRMKYEDAALPILNELNTLAAADESGFIPSWKELRALRAMICSCIYDLTDFSTSTPSETPSAHKENLPPPPNPECFYVIDLKSDISFPLDTPGPPPVSPDVPHEQGWDSRFSNAINRVLRLRCLVRTQKGYLGLVPDSSRVGDSVCLLQGASIPFILRLVDPKEEEGTGENLESKERWKVVGESYVHGVMQGEVWEKVKEEDIVDIDLV